MNERNRCVACPRSVLQRRHHVLSLEFLESRRDFVEHMFSTFQAPQEIAFDGSRAICHPCWQRIDYSLRRPPSPPPRPPTASISEPGFARAANTSRRCIVDDCRSLELRAVPNSMKVYILSYFHLYIPPLARICSHHLRNTTWEDLPGSIARRQDDFRGENLRDIVELYTQALEKKKLLDFEKIDEISPDELHNWIGINHQQFYSILEETPSLQQRSDRNTILGVYLSKLRTGAPYRRLETVFGLSKTTINRKMKLARQCLSNDYVPRHLGFDHITRNEVIARNRIIPNYIFGTEDHTKAIVIMDGTYLFLQKSSNFLFQRLSYSLHKYSNLVKPFMIVCADGYIIEVTGPYNARTSDATILKQILDNHSEPMEEAVIRWFFEPDDVLVLDRGFRDALPDAEECGFTVYTPQTLSRHESQLSTEAANKSRLVTLVRWVVETVNGRMKRDFKIFRNKYFNISLPRAMTDFRIAAALVNATQEPYGDSRLTANFIEMIERKINRQNQLAEYVHENRLNAQRNIAFTRMEATDVVDFPRMTSDELLIFAIGTYHVKIARSYCYEHIRETGVYTVEMYRHPERVTFNEEGENTLIRCRIHSRHITTRTYYCFIAYNSHAVTEYYCSCIHGRRTLGSCAHITSIIYYLAWARHEGQLNQPAGFLDLVCLDIENN